MKLEEKLRRLVASVQLLAAKPSVQIQLLPDSVVKADEIATLFDDCFGFLSELIAAGSISEAAIQRLKHLDNLLSEMTSEGERLWNDEALRTSPMWSAVRESAISALYELNVSVDTPRIDWVTFVRAGEQDDESTNGGLPK